jgi:hypothetical protein
VFSSGERFHLVAIELLSKEIGKERLLTLLSAGPFGLGWKSMILIIEKAHYDRAFIFDYPQARLQLHNPFFQRRQPLS